jgi:hypothetical protein
MFGKESLVGRAGTTQTLVLFENFKKLRNLKKRLKNILKIFRKYSKYQMSSETQLHAKQAM